ncbi:GNAT family N-acetyltransferase [Fusibacter bizertensis]
MKHEMKYTISEMDNSSANQICDWQYTGGYSIYSFDGSDACKDELLNGDYYTVRDQSGALMAYLCYGSSAQVPIAKALGLYQEDHLDVGIGLLPELSGKGLGKSILTQGIIFGKEKFKRMTIRLTVAEFNTRAIKLYRSLGFVKVSTFTRVCEGIQTDFEVMVMK